MRGHLPRPSRRARRRLPFAEISLALVLTAGACGTGAEAPPATAGGERSTTAPGNRTTDADESAALPYETGSVVATTAGIWVFPHLDAVALRLSGEGEIEHEVRLTAYATAAAGGEGMLWARTEGDQQSYTRIDPSTGAVLARIVDVPGDAPIIAAGFVWAAGADGTLFRIDPRANRVERARAQSTGPFLLSAARGTIWTLGVDGLVGVDPGDLSTTAPWRPITVLGHRPHHMASNGDNLLFATPAAVAEVDPIAHTKVGESAAPAGTQPLGAASSPDPAAQVIWAFHTYPDAIPNPPRGSRPTRVTIARLDPSTGTTDVLGTAPFPEFQGMAVDGGVLWVSPLRERRTVRLSLA